MKKLLFAITLVSILAVANASAWFGCNGCGGCKTTCTRAATPCPETCEARPVCYKMVRKEAPARKVCEKICHYECPSDTIREEAAL